MARAKSPNKNAASANGNAGTNGTATQSTQSKTNLSGSALQMSSAAESKAANAQLARPSRATDTKVHPSVSEEKIRQRAYELYMQRGGQHGKHVDDWFRAEAELRGRR